MTSSPYDRSSLPRHEHGGIVVDGRQVGSTEQCPHCGGHFLSVKGSGKRRGWCTKCYAKTCGNPLCDICIPMAVALDFAERRKVQQRYADLIKQHGHLIVGQSTGMRDQWNHPQKPFA